MAPEEMGRDQHRHRLADLSDHGRARVDSLVWPLTISHRGGPGVYPEHSWEAKSGSVDSGFVPEFDLRLLSDGRTLVNCHDATVDRTMNNIGTGPVASKTISQWQRARIKPAIPGGAEGRPVFWDEVLDRWAGRVVLVAELKDPYAVEVFLDGVLSRGVGPSILAQSFDLATASRLAAAGVDTVFLCDTTPAQTPAQIKAAGVNYFASNVATTPRATVTAMQAVGIRTLGYTVHTLSEATTPAALLWDGLFSDDAWRTTEQIPIRSGDPFADGIRPHGMDVYCAHPVDDTLVDPITPIRLVGRRLGFSQPSALVPYASQPWAGKLLARPLRVSMRLGFGTGGEQSASLGFVLSTAASGRFDPTGRPGQQAYAFGVRRDGALTALRYSDGCPGVVIGASPAGGQAYAPPGWEAEVDFSVILEADRLVLHAQGGAAAPQQLVVPDAGAPGGLELTLQWMASTTGASGFISDIDIG